MNQIEHYARADLIPGPIREVGLHNPFVRRVMDQFIVGQICTLEEALCQMVLGLARNWDREQQEAFKLAMLSMPPIILSQDQAKAAGVTIEPKP